MRKSLLSLFRWHRQGQSATVCKWIQASAHENDLEVRCAEDLLLLEEGDVRKHKFAIPNSAQRAKHFGSTNGAKNGKNSSAHEKLENVVANSSEM